MSESDCICIYIFQPIIILGGYFVFFVSNKNKNRIACRNSCERLEWNNNFLCFVKLT